MPPNEIESVWPPEAEPWSATTPGASSVRSRKSRDLSGRLAICCVSTSVRTTFSVVFDERRLFGHRDGLFEAADLERERAPTPAS